MNRSVILGVAGWLAVAAAATTAGVMAIDVLEDGITGKNVRPLDDEAVHRALSRSTAAPSPTPLTLTPSPAGGVTRNLASGGGTVTARCEGGQVTIVAAIPAQGFRTDGFARGPATSAALTFESAAAEYHVTVGCDGDRPVIRPVAGDDHGDRQRGRGGGGGRGRG